MQYFTWWFSASYGISVFNSFTRGKNVINYRINFVWSWPVCANLFNGIYITLRMPVNHCSATVSSRSSGCESIARSIHEVVGLIWIITMMTMNLTILLQYWRRKLDISVDYAYLWWYFNTFTLSILLLELETISYLMICFFKFNGRCTIYTELFTMYVFFITTRTHNDFLLIYWIPIHFLAAFAAHVLITEYCCTAFFAEEEVLACHFRYCPGYCSDRT